MYGQTVTRRDRVNQHNGRSASSARKRNGPGPQISIRARGVDEPHHEAGHTTAPDHMPAPTKKLLASSGASTHVRDALLLRKVGDRLRAACQPGLARDCERFSGGRYRAAERQAAADGATIRRFEHALPSLDEIFVKVVKP